MHDPKRVEAAMERAHGPKRRYAAQALDDVTILAEEVTRLKDQRDNLAMMLRRVVRQAPVFRSRVDDLLRRYSM